MDSNPKILTRDGLMAGRELPLPEAPYHSTPNTIKKTGNKPKLRDKIDAKCRACIYDDQAEGTWRKQVENCTSLDCPLFAVRPKCVGSCKS